jgi:hypothetical protein
MLTLSKKYNFFGLQALSKERIFLFIHMMKNIAWQWSTIHLSGRKETNQRIEYA